jgi:ribonucleotide monophosphatase NagD (HAD superfamily)
VLVLTGVTTRPEEIERYPYRPTRVVASVAELEVE